MITFKNLPDTTTPINADNLNSNFNELKEKNAITMGLYSTQTTASRTEKIRLQNYKTKGSKLTISNYGIKIGTGVSEVLVSANLQAEWDSPVSNDFLLYIYVNDTPKIRVNGQKTSSTVSASVTLNPTLINVNDGDEIYLYYIGSAENSKIYGLSSVLCTNLTVEVI